MKNYGSTDYTDCFTIKIPKQDSRIPLYPTEIRKYEGPRLFGMCKSSIFLSIFLFLFILYLISGAAIFSILEGPAEQAVRGRLDKTIQHFMVANPGVSYEDLETLISEVVKASNRGVTASRNATGEPNWSFGQSLFFSSTVVTTVGYGHVTPLSKSGKLFCIIYAVIGIPMTLVLLSALVERLLSPTIWLLQWLNSRLGHLYQPFKIRLIHLSIIVFILVSVFLMIPAAVFSSIEPDWDYLDSFYYCFISLTTIGLGDYIPGDSLNQSYRPLYKIATAVYLFIGITFMMLTLAVFYDIPQLNLGLLFTNAKDDSEKVGLASAGFGLQYGSGDEENIRQTVKVKPRRGNDSPSPEESTSGDFLP